MSTENGTDDATDLWKQARSRLLPGVMIGSTVEWYDFGLYALMSALVFPRLFFPQLSPVFATLASFGTFGAAFVARPIGAIVFGNVGDRSGRRNVLVITLVLMGACTTCIGLLPTYAAIGVLAPVLLVVLRLLQGLGAGAEYAGALVMTAEMAPAPRRGFLAALPGVGIYAGTVLASSVAALVFTLPRAALFSWGWRVPFLVSFLLIIIGVVLRAVLPEPPAFTAVKAGGAVHRFAVGAVLKNAPGRLFAALLLTAPIAFSSYLFSTFFTKYMTERGLSAAAVVTTGLIAAGLIPIVSVPLVGRLCDAYGRRPVFIALCVMSIVFPFPEVVLLGSGSFGLALLGRVLVAISVLSMTGAQAAFLAEIFPSSYRLSGVALSRELSTAVLTAPAPVIATALALALGGQPWLVAAAMMVVAAACLAAVLVLPETRAADLSEVPSPPERAERTSTEEVVG
jgi:MFS family permease